MFRRYSTNFVVISMLVDILLTSFALYVAAIWRTSTSTPFIPITNHHIPLWMRFAIPAIWTCIFVLTSVYDHEKTYKFINEIQALVVALFISSLILAGLLYLTNRDLSRGLYISFIVIDLAMLFSWRIVLRVCAKIGVPPVAKRNVIIVGAGIVGQKVASMVMQYGIDRLNLVGFLDDSDDLNIGDYEILGRTLDIPSVIERHKIDDVIIALPLSAYLRSNEIILALQSKAVNIRVIPDYFNLALYRAKFDSFGSIPMINLRDPAMNDFERMMKRILDIILGLLILICISPLMGLLACLIKLDSAGPILFRQNRVGENGRIFKMLKFRSMVPDAEARQSQVNLHDNEGNVIHKSKSDPRVTRFGRLLRRTSLDELPQLINVLLGDMSLVGPRPEMPWLVNEYEPWQHTRFAVPQGITGWWQVHGRADKPMHLNSTDDIYYIQNYSIWMDLYILLRTPLVVIRGKGAF